MNKITLHCYRIKKTMVFLKKFNKFKWAGKMVELQTMLILE